MLKPSLKGVAWGTALFFILLLSGSAFVNLIDADLTKAPIYWAYVATWAVPGFVAARIAGKNGVVNGALVGVIAGVLIGGASQIFFSNPPPNVESISGIEVGLRMGLAVLILSSIGGLVWDLWHRFTRPRAR